jgi:hypothetical protein
MNSVSNDYGGITGGVIVGGFNNVIFGSLSFIGGGQCNVADALNYQFIGGGFGNNVSGGAAPTEEIGSYNAVAGGCCNTASRGASFVGGGRLNRALGELSGVFSGFCNEISSPSSAIAGGRHNTITKSSHSFIGGGTGHTIVEPNSEATNMLYNSILGGNNNKICSSSSCNVILGGITNTIRNSGLSVVDNGESNTICCGGYSNISNGFSNTICRNDYSKIGGGQTNTICAPDTYYSRHNTILGGISNKICTISGGVAQRYGDFNLIGGGTGNVLNLSRSSTILNGERNTIDQVTNDCGKFISILGGTLNCVYDSCYNVIAGGDQNCSTKSNFSFIGGGVQNTAVEAPYSSIAGGYLASTSLYGQRAFANGGFNNEPGSAQQIDLIARIETTSTSPSVFYLDGFQERLYIPTNHAWYVTINVAGLGDSYHGASHQIRKAAIVNIGGTTSLIGTVSTIGTDTNQSWLSIPTLTISADNTNDALSISIQAYDSARTRWVAHVQGIQMRIGSV